MPSLHGAAEKIAAASDFLLAVLSLAAPMIGEIILDEFRQAGVRVVTADGNRMAFTRTTDTNRGATQLRFRS